MKNNVKFIIYISILIIFASVIWIKYDHDQGKKDNTNIVTEDLFLEFIRDNNIKKSSFTCPAKNESIVYLDDEYLLTSSGDIYQVNYDSVFETGHNCKLLDSPIKIKGFYGNNKTVYDNEYQFYDVDTNFTLYDEGKVGYYIEDLNNVNTLNDKYPYIYLYDVEAKELELDNSLLSNKVLIDNKGNINIYTGYGYPVALSILDGSSVEIVFDRLDYMGVILSIYRSSNNETLSSNRVKYLRMSEEVPDEVYGLRVITNKGIYNEVIDTECDEDVCDTKLVMDKEFSKYFNNIVYSNGKYVFIKDTPTIIYNIEGYVAAK